MYPNTYAATSEIYNIMLKQNFSYKVKMSTSYEDIHNLSQQRVNLCGVPLTILQAVGVMLLLTFFLGPNFLFSFVVFNGIIYLIRRQANNNNSNQFIASSSSSSTTTTTTTSSSSTSRPNRNNTSKKGKPNIKTIGDLPPPTSGS